MSAQGKKPESENYFGGTGQNLLKLERSGLAWSTAPADSAEAGRLAEVLTRWRSLPSGTGAAVLKENRIRTVLLLEDEPGRPAGAARWVLKHYRHGSRRDRLKHLFVASRAVTEWQALRRLRALGFDAPRPIAVGERRQGGSPVEGGLVMEEVPGARSLLEALAAAQAGTVQTGTVQTGTGTGVTGGGVLATGSADLLARAGALVRALHDRGADPVDIHGGNFLLAGEGPRRGEIHVIDLHSARFRRLGRGARIGRLGKLAHSLEGTVPLAGVRALCAGYLGLPAAPAAGDRAAPARRYRTAGARTVELDRLVRAVIRWTGRIEARRLRSRSRRCVLESTQFAVERAGGARIFRRREVPRDHLDILFAGAGRVLKEDRQGRVETAEVGGRWYLVKRRRISLREGLLALVDGHRLARAWRAGFALEVRGVSTPAVLALREDRRLGILRSACLVTACDPGSMDLEQFLQALYLGRPAARGVEAHLKFLIAKRVGDLIRSLHGAGIHSPDLAPKNIIVLPEALRAEAAGRPWAGGAALSIADLDGVRPWRRPTLRRRLRALIQAGNLPEGHVTWTDRLRALKASAAPDPSLLTRPSIAFLREGLLREAERTLARMLRALRR